MRSITEHRVKDPRIPELMTITKISLSKDLHYCHLFFTIIGNDKKNNEALKGLNSAAGFIQKHIASTLNLTYTPTIQFRYDEKDEKAYKIDSLLDELSNERKNNEKKVN